MIISQAFAATAHAGEHSVFQDPTFWVAIAFFITVFMLIKLAGKAISGALQARADKIAARLEEAEKLRIEAEVLLAEYTARYEELEQTAKDALEQADEKARKMKENLQQEFEEKLKKKQDAAEARLSRAADEASEEVRELAIKIASEAVERILAEKLSGDAGQKMIDDAIEALPAVFSKQKAG